MFTNVEKKLKGIAVIELICGIIIAVACLAAMDIPAAPVVLLTSLISPWLIYAFAELLENTKKIRHTMEIVFAEALSREAKRQRQAEEARKDENQKRWEKAGSTLYAPYWVKGPEDRGDTRPDSQRDAK